MTREDLIEEGWKIHDNISDILVKGNIWCLYGIRSGFAYDATRIRFLDTINDFILFDGHCDNLVEFKKLVKKLKL